jgi:hypothetical protein
MGKARDEIDPELATWIAKQKLFFVATAPLAGDGLVNCSPKGIDTFRVLAPRQVAYLDLTGSGIETVAHLRENGRIVVMFCAFEGAPKIVRLHGRGRAVIRGDAEFERLAPHFDVLPGARSIVCVDVRRVADSCGYGVPRFDYRGEREQLAKWAEAKGDDGVAVWRRSRNATSLDGLPGLAPET